jgi:hypothetical protein
VGAGFAGPLLFPPGGAFQGRENQEEPAMVSVVERRKHARSKQPAGRVSHYAQQRVDQRVMDVMARHDAQRREGPSDQVMPARRLASSRP